MSTVDHVGSLPKIPQYITLLHNPSQYSILRKLHTPYPIQELQQLLRRAYHTLQGFLSTWNTKWEGKAYGGYLAYQKRHPTEPYSRTMPRLLWRSWGGVSYERGTPVLTQQTSKRFRKHLIKNNP